MGKFKDDEAPRVCMCRQMANRLSPCSIQFDPDGPKLLKLVLRTPIITFVFASEWTKRFIWTPENWYPCRNSRHAHNASPSMPPCHFHFTQQEGKKAKCQVNTHPWLMYLHTKLIIQFCAMQPKISEYGGIYYSYRFLNDLGFEYSMSKCEYIYILGACVLNLGCLDM